MNYLYIGVSLSLMVLMPSATYLGCFKDEGSRAMPEGPGPAGSQYYFTPQSCSQRCSSYKFFAIQYYGSDCWCSNNLVDATRYGYSNSCPSGANEGLGGSWCNAIFAQVKIFAGVNTLVNYDTANAACANGAPLTLSGGQLATWGSQAEYDKLVAIRNEMNKDAYIGLNDITQEGQWRMVDGDTSYCDDFDGSDCDNIPQWSSGEPNDVNSEDVAEIWSNGKLNDINHGDNNAYICEFNYFVADYTASASAPFAPLAHAAPNYYVLEFASIKDMIVIASILLNIVLLTFFCFTNFKAFGRKSGYSKVKMYATEDEKL